MLKGSTKDISDERAKDYLMKTEKIRRQVTIAQDLMFLGLFLSIITFSAIAFLDIIFVVPAFVSFLIWLALTLMVLRKTGVSVKASFLHRRLISGLPCNKILHGIYIGALLVSLMLFFTLMLVGRELYLLFSFLMWLFIGSLATQELEGEAEPTKKR
jgi:hypothetical protein